MTERSQLQQTPSEAKASTADTHKVPYEQPEVNANPCRRNSSFSSYLSRELLGAALFFIAIPAIVLGAFTLLGFVQKPPPNTLKITMPKPGHEINGVPAYENTVQIPIPFSAGNEDFVFAEIVEDSIYQETVDNKGLVKFEKGQTYPTLKFPVDMSLRKQSLSGSFSLPVHDLKKSGNEKYWIRIGIVTFDKSDRVYKSGIVDLIVCTLAGDFGKLVLPFVENGIEVHRSGKWTEYSQFWVVASREVTAN
jgi:hypothetical protein